MTTKPGDIVYVKRAAAILSCTPKHVRDMVKDGRLEALKLGPRGIRVFVASVEEYIENNKVNPEDYYK
ncbi:MAG: helix-turn-helix domain-containing protein [Smithella sp.]